MCAEARSGCVSTLAIVHLLAGCRDDPPRRAELVEALARRLARLAVAHVVVERVTVVGDLELAVCALRRAEERRVNAGAGDRLAGGRDRRPESGAGAVAGTH